MSESPASSGDVNARVGEAPAPAGARIERESVLWYYLVIV
jgi:hypothetical protein